VASAQQELFARPMYYPMPILPLAKELEEGVP